MNDRIKVGTPVAMVDGRALDWKIPPKILNGMTRGVVVDIDHSYVEVNWGVKNPDGSDRVLWHWVHELQEVQ